MSYLDYECDDLQLIQWISQTLDVTYGINCQLLRDRLSRMNVIAKTTDERITVRQLQPIIEQLYSLMAAYQRRMEALIPISNREDLRWRLYQLLEQYQRHIHIQNRKIDQLNAIISWKAARGIVDDRMDAVQLLEIMIDEIDYLYSSAIDGSNLVKDYEISLMNK